MIFHSIDKGSTLFKATNSTTNILEISGKGDFKVDKVVYPLHSLENPDPILTGNFIFDPPSIGWRIFNPTVALNGNTDSDSFNVSRGSDFYITKSGDAKRYYLWEQMENPTTTSNAKPFQFCGALGKLVQTESYGELQCRAIWTNRVKALIWMRTGRS